ncbi:MAG: ferrous iron transporter B [Dakarella massiliensis]
MSDGIFAGVGSVPSFFPLIVILFFFLSLLEDTGYMARVAFVMDKLLRKIGLSGRSIVPMLIGFGCTVPAVMSTRTLPSERDRKMTILLTPFMSCSAKMTIYAFFTAAFFPKSGALVMIALVLRRHPDGDSHRRWRRTKPLFRGDAVPFVMELPNYRIPSRKKSVRHLVWDKTKDFLVRAFTVIFIATIVVWFLQSFGLSLTMVDDPENSLLAIVAGWIAPLFAPLGLGDWTHRHGAHRGLHGERNRGLDVVGAVRGSDARLCAYAAGGAVSLLVFCLLYTPCVAAISSIKQELGRQVGAGDRGVPVRRRVGGRRNR